MLGLTATLAGTAAAVGCCLVPARRRARILAILMAVCCLPALPAACRPIAALVLLAAALVLAAGARRRPDPERSADLHRALGGVLMAVMLLAGGHGTAPPAAHAHGMAASPHLLVGLAGVAYLGWTLAVALRPLHGPGRGAVSRVEPGAMGVMVAATLLGMALR